MISSLAGNVRALVRPTAFALLLALVAWPLVASTMTAVHPVYDVGGPELPASPLARWSAAASAVFISALVAGPIGGIAVRRNAIGGAMLTFVLALMVAIASVTLLPMVLGQEIGVACESAIAPGFSSSPCDPNITTRNLANDLQAVPFFWLAPLAEPIPVLILAVGVSVWTAAIARPTWRRHSVT
jgi:ABC-type branched-subunit amino acid transport system permease subunit